MGDLEIIYINYINKFIELFPINLQQNNIQPNLLKIQDWIKLANVRLLLKEFGLDLRQPKYITTHVLYFTCLQIYIKLSNILGLDISEDYIRINYNQIEYNLWLLKTY